jgi:hypothetical protein
MTGERQRHRDLTIVLLAKLAAILSSHSDRMLPFLGKAGVVNDPRFDRPVAFQLWLHQFPHLRENLLVRPSSLADKMQQRLMLGSGPALVERTLAWLNRCRRLTTRIGRTSIAQRSRFCASPQSGSCSESFVILTDVFGQTLI